MTGGGPGFNLGRHFILTYRPQQTEKQVSSPWYSPSPLVPIDTIPQQFHSLHPCSHIPTPKLGVRPLLMSRSNKPEEEVGELRLSTPWWNIVHMSHYKSRQTAHELISSTLWVSPPHYSKSHLPPCHSALVLNMCGDALFEQKTHQLLEVHVGHLPTDIPTLKVSNTTLFTSAIHIFPVPNCHKDTLKEQRAHLPPDFWSQIWIRGTIVESQASYTDQKKRGEQIETKEQNIHSKGTTWEIEI